MVKWFLSIFWIIDYPQRYATYNTTNHMFLHQKPTSATLILFKISNEMGLDLVNKTVSNFHVTKLLKHLKHVMIKKFNWMRYILNRKKKLKEKISIILCHAFWLFHFHLNMLVVFMRFVYINCFSRSFYKPVLYMKKILKSVVSMCDTLDSAQIYL